MSERIGWIGLGVMGRWMASHIMDKGYTLSVYNRTASKCDVLRQKGAYVCQSPVEVARRSDIVFTMVSYPKDVEDVILGQNGVLEGMRAGGVVVDMTTSEPSLARKIAEQCRTKGILSLDAPVSGGDVGAKEARLSIMVGGDQDALNRVTPLFQAMGKNITYLGAAGSGQHTKMVNQILICNNMMGVVEGLLYGHRAGLDLKQVISAVGAGAAGSWSINNLGPRIVDRNFDPGFFVEHFIKDMGIALVEAKRMNIALPGLALANQLYLALQAQGHGRKGTHALMLALETLNGVQHNQQQQQQQAESKQQ